MKQSVFNHKQSNMSENIPCREVHVINGKVPTENDLEYEGLTCDCGKLKFYLEECGCQFNKHNVLKSKPAHE